MSMRCSIQYPSHDLSCKIGLLSFGLCFLAFASFIIASPLTNPSRETIPLTISLDRLPIDFHGGNVYLLSEESGEILQVGRFSVQNTGGLLKMHMPAHHYSPEHMWTLLAWHSRYPDYRAFMSFLHDDRLETRMTGILNQVFEDPQLRADAELLGRGVLEQLYRLAQPRMAELAREPEFRSVIPDIVLEEAVNHLRRGERVQAQRTWVQPRMALT